MEITQIVPYLLEREAEAEETLCHVARQAARHTFLADCRDCRRIGLEGRFHAIDAGSRPAST
jgi:hypothetical protein